MIKKLLLLASVLIIGTGAVASVFAQTVAARPRIPEVIAPLEPVTIKPIDIPNVGLKMGIRHGGVRKVQEALKALGLLPQDHLISDYFDSKTKEALKAFQMTQKLKSDGYLGPTTRKRLKSAIEAEKDFREKEIDLSCMQKAVQVREDALIAGYTTYTDKVRNARTTRKTDLLNAWAIEDKEARHQAINEAWKKFRDSILSAEREWHKNRRTAWVQFWKDRVNCGAPISGESESLENIEAQE